jgi:Ca-activated chloride channel family protein
MTRLLAALGLCVAAGAVAVLAQPTFRAGVDVVRIDVAVMNGLAPVPGLTADNFAVSDNGVTQELESVSLDAVPLSMTLVLDTSGSMAGERIDDLIEAVTTLAKKLQPADAAALITFSEPMRFLVPMTRERQPLLSALAGLVATGYTSLNDAVFMGLQMRPIDPGETRPVLIVFSDGQDSSSWLSSVQLIEAARRSRMLALVVELIGADAGGVSRSSDVLRDLASATGGRHWVAQNSRDLGGLFNKAIDELRSRYLLTYVPKGVAREGWHDVKVTLKGARGEVTARPGYFAAPQ